MRIGRTLPPVAAPLAGRDLAHAVAALWSPNRALRSREEEIRTYFGVRHVSLVSSGTAALTLALIAVRDLSERSDVVIPAFTCYSVPAAVLAAGLQPVLCDVDPSTLDFDHVRLERMLTDRTLCVVAHHLFGVPSDIQRLRQLCHARGIFLIEDAAQAMGIAADGGYLGTRGDVGVFSLGRGKNVTCGAGGIVVAQTEAIAEAIEYRCRSFTDPSFMKVLSALVSTAVMTVFIRPSLYWLPSALPFLRLGEAIFPENVPLQRLSGMQAGLFHRWREHLGQSNRIRSENSVDLNRRLPLKLPVGYSHPYLRLPVLAATREEKKRIFDMSRRQGLGVSEGYPARIDQIPQLAGYFDAESFPGATTLAEHLLTIPTHHWLGERDKAALAKCFGTAVRAVPSTHVGQTASSLEAVHHG